MRFPVKEAVVGALLATVVFLALRGYNVLPVFFFAGLLFTLGQMNQMRSGSAASRQRTPSTRSIPQVTFDDIGGQEPAKRELMEALNFMADQEATKRMGIRPLKGILLTGPPGTGKTLLAKAAARFTGSVFLASSGSEFVEMYAGVGAQRVRDLFRKARETARREKTGTAVIFIDEIDVLGGRRGAHAGHMEYDQTLNQLLTELDGISTDPDVRILLIAATNRVDMLDPALLRPGRFDRTVAVDLPDREGRLAILNLHAKGKPLAADVDLAQMARQAFGFSGAHLESLVNEAAILALRESAEEVHQRHLIEAVDKVILGEKLDRRPTPGEKWRVAVHEAGHAIVGEWSRPGSVSNVTITPRGRAMGYVRSAETEERYLYTREMLEAQVRVALAGYLAEEAVMGQRSTGAVGDYGQALDLARQIISTGLVGGLADLQLAGDKQNEAVLAILQQQEELVRTYLVERQELLQQIAQELLDAEVINGDDLRARLAAA